MGWGYYSVSSDEIRIKLIEKYMKQNPQKSRDHAYNATSDECTL